MDQNDSIKRNRIIRLLKKIMPPAAWRFPVIILLGIFTGLGLFILYISNAVSYLSDDPATCINCHVMNPQFATWQNGSHGRVAICNDCHVPHDNIFKKYFFKASDGLRHATMFTFRLEPQVIQIKEAGKEAVQQNCIRCHSSLIHPISLRAINNESVEEQRPGYCWDCHRETPHGKVTSLSSTPYSRIYKADSVIPNWMKKYLNN